MFENGRELKLKYGEENVFDFSLGNPDVAPPKKFFDIYSKITQNTKTSDHSYMPNAGYISTREKLANYLSKIYNKKISANNLILTSGAAGAINIALKSILNPEDEIIIISPFFPEYIFYIDNHNGQPIIVDSDENFDLNIENIEKKITQKTKGIIINSPNNPTGKVYSKNKLSDLSKLLEKYEKKYNHPIYIISDEPYRNIVYDKIEIPSLLELHPNTIIANSYSKELSIPGERIGYALINPDCAGKDILFDALVLCNRICGFVNAPATIQRVLEKLIEDYEAVNIKLYEVRRNKICDMLKEIGYELTKPAGAFYLFPKSPIEDDIEFINILLKENVLCVPGSGFGRKGYFRIAYCVDEKIIEKSYNGFKNAFLSAKNKNG